MSNPQLIFDLSKATKDKTKLVQKQVQVTRGGKTFTQTVWVKPSQATSSQSVGLAFDFSEFEKLKSDKVKALQYLKDNGITWQEHNHSGVNWMRACMAASKAGGISKQSNSPNKTAKTKSGGAKTVPKLDYNKLLSSGYDNLDGKKKTASIKKEMSKDEFISLASSIVSWTHSNHHDVNFMRASMEFKKWCDTHSLNDLQAALAGQAVQIKQQADKPVEPPKPKEELEIKSTHSEREKNMINLINTISNTEDLEKFASAGIVPEDDTAKSFVLDKLLPEYDKHIRNKDKNKNGKLSRRIYFDELRRGFVSKFSKLYKGVSKNILKDSCLHLSSDSLISFVDPRNVMDVHRGTKLNAGDNRSLVEIITELQKSFGTYADYDNNLGSNSSYLDTEYDVEKSKNEFKKEKDGFYAALGRIGDFDPTLKKQTEEMQTTYLEMMELVGYNTKLFEITNDNSYDQIKASLDSCKLDYQKHTLFIDELKKYGLSDSDIEMTVRENAYDPHTAQSFPIYKQDPDKHYMSIPILDDQGNQVHIDLTKVCRTDTGEPFWKDTDKVVGSYGDGDVLRTYGINHYLNGRHRTSKMNELNALESITPQKYNKFIQLSCKLVGVQLQDVNSDSNMTKDPNFNAADWDSMNWGDVIPVKNEDNIELDTIVANLSLMRVITNTNNRIANYIIESRPSANNRNGTDYSGNFSYHDYNAGNSKTLGIDAPTLTSAEKNKIITQQLNNISLFTKQEIINLQEYVDKHGDPSITTYGRVSDKMAKVESLSPRHRDWEGIQGTPINDIYMKCIESTAQYCPQLYNSRVKTKEDLKKWLHKQTGFTPYQPHQTNQSTQSTTSLYELRKTLFEKAHCSLRTADSQQGEDIKHQVKVNFDYPSQQDRIYRNYSLALHGNVYVINNTAEFSDNFEKEVKRLEDVKAKTNDDHIKTGVETMYHGTSYAGGCGILGVDGRFRISEEELKDCQTTGKMLGPGIYMATRVGKTLPYLGNKKYSYRNISLSGHTTPTENYDSDGCLLVCETTLGKHFNSAISTSEAKAQNKYNDSVSAGQGAFTGFDSLKEYECCLTRNNLVLPKYIVDCGGRARR